MFKIKTKRCIQIFFLCFFILIFFNTKLSLYAYVILVAITVFVSIPVISRYLLIFPFFLYDLFSKSIIVNALVSTRFCSINHFNLGDDLNWYLIKKIQSKKVSLLNKSILGRIRFLKKNNYLIIGSTVNTFTNERTIIWGAGVVDDHRPLNSLPQKVCAVRGPRTRRYLLEKGVDCPAIYGDPAMLIKYFYAPQQEKKYKLGIIPHYIDYCSPLFDRLKENPNVLFIKMQNYKSVDCVIKQITSCERILSSSLHGLIIAESFEIPNMWIKVSDKIIGGSFKFIDYYESIGIYNNKPYLFTGCETEDELINLFSKYQKGYIDLDPLIKSAPFKLRIPSYSSEKK